MNLSQKGSETAKSGFKNEDDIVIKFNNWSTDLDAQEWLITMEYNISEVASVMAIKLSGYKTDIQIQVTIKLKGAIDVQNLQVKLVSNTRGFNQIDKRWVDRYIEMWNIPHDVMYILKRYTGEECPDIKCPRDKRRMFADEFREDEQRRILQWINDNQTCIVSDVLKGRGHFAAEWMLVAMKNSNNVSWVLKSMNYCMNYFGNGDVIISPRGCFKIGRITMQRKGGDGGRKTANMLQFKINPAELFV